MHPRSRTRRRDPASEGGRHRRRSPPARHQRRPPPPRRRSPDRPPPRRYDDEIPTPIADPGRSRADILLEAGRLAAHYLVARGVIPDHLLRARDHATVSRSDPPVPPPPPAAPSSAPSKRDDEDARWRRRDDWGRANKEDDDRQSRRLGWDRRRHSFDERRRKYDSARRTRDDDDPKMSRSYSHNDRRTSFHFDGRLLDPKRKSRSRSRSRSRTRARRDSDGRPATRHPKLPDSGITPADGEMPRKHKVPSSESADRLTAAIQDGDMDHAQHVSDEEDGEFAEDVSQGEDGEFAADVSEDKDGEFAADASEDKDGAEMDVTEHPLYDVEVHLSESVEEEPVHTQSQPRNLDEESNAGAAPMDASIMAEPSADKDGSTQVGDEMEAPQSEADAAVGNLYRDEQELPAWYRFFDLNAPEGCEMPEISGDSLVGHVCNSLPNLDGQMNRQTDYASSELQGQDEHAGANHPLEYQHDLSKNDLNNVINEHSPDDTSNIQGQDEDLSHEADTHAHDCHLLSNEGIRINLGIAEDDSDSCCLSNEQILLEQNADEQGHDDHQIETEHMLLVHQGTSEPDLDSYHVSHKQFALSHVTDEQVVNKHQLEPESMHLPMDVHDVDIYNLNHEQMLLNDITSKHAQEDTCQMKDGETLLDQVVVDGRAGVHNVADGRAVPVIDLEDDYKQQPDTRDTGKFLEPISDQEASSFSDNPHSDIQTVSFSSVTPNFEKRCTGRGAVNSQVIPGEDDALSGDKMSSEVINAWELPSSELGKSS